jgi:hypothetical protein
MYRLIGMMICGACIIATGAATVSGIGWLVSHTTWGGAVPANLFVMMVCVIIGSAVLPGRR